jgi:activating signal cointegrator complex subunit 3
MIDACAENGWLASTLHCINLVQMVVQARWLKDDVFLTLPFVDEVACLALVDKFLVDTLPELQEKTVDNTLALEQCLIPVLDQPNQLQTIIKVLQQLPIVKVGFQVQHEDKKIDVPFAQGAKKTWIDLPAGKTLTLIVHLERLNQFPRDGKVHAPKFPKSKDEGWFLILGDVENRDMLALKRTSGLKRKLQQQLEFRTPERLGRVIYTFYLMCDSYLGLDQQYEICFNIVPSNQNQSQSQQINNGPPPGF